MARGWQQRAVPGFAGLIGPLWTRKEDGNWAYGIVATIQHANPAGLVHGGLLTSLADHSLTSTAWKALGRKACVIVQLDTNFLSTVRVGTFLEARARVVHTTSTLVFMQGAISVEGRDVSSATAILKIIEKHVD